MLSYPLRAYMSGRSGKVRKGWSDGKIKYVGEKAQSIFPGEQHRTMTARPFHSILSGDSPPGSRILKIYD